MFKCPMCRQVSNLTASLSSEQINHLEINEENDFNGSMGSLYLGGSGARSPPQRRSDWPNTNVNLEVDNSIQPKSKPKFSKRVSTFFHKVGGAAGAIGVSDSRDALAGTQGSLNSLSSSKDSLKSNLTANVDSPSVVVASHCSQRSTPTSSNNVSLLGGPPTPRKLGLDTNRLASGEMLDEATKSARVEMTSNRLTGEPNGKLARRANSARK